MSASLLFATLLALGAASAPVPETVRRIEVEGNLRVPTATILRNISLRQDMPLDRARARADLLRLHSLGAFAKLEVGTRDAGGGRVDVIYRVRERPFVSAFILEGVDPGTEEQIRDRLREAMLDIRPATPYNPGLAHKAARAARDLLRARRHPAAEVVVVAEETGSTVRVLLDIHPGPRLDIGEVRVTGDTTATEGELRRQLKRTRPARLWAAITGEGRYVPEDLTSDLEELARYCRSRGHAEVFIGRPEIRVQTFQQSPWLRIPFTRRQRQRLVIEVPLRKGPRFQLESVELIGDAKAASEEVERLVKMLPTPSRYDASLLDATRQKIADALGRRGYALAQVKLEQATDPARQTVRATFRVDAGEPTPIRRIEFQGNRRLPERFLRRELRVHEGEMFNSALLDRSVEQLNHSGLLQKMDRADVSLRINEGEDAVDLLLKVKEKERQSVFGTGGSGGIGGGYLGMLYNAFNLLGLGETLTLELDGGAAQSNMLLNMAGTHFLGTPFTLGLSAFTRFTDFRVASIIPGTQSLVRVLARRSRGIGLSGTYPVTSNFRAGLGVQLERDSTTDAAEPHQNFLLLPVLSFDSTSGEGPSARGTSLVVSPGFSGTTLLRRLDSTQGAFRITRHTGDPSTRGRNSLAFQFTAAAVRAHGGRLLDMERRLFPGDESVRGFSRGGLSPWAQDPEGSSSELQPAGADTFLGFSAEYRVPIRSALSGAAFWDLGWSRLAQGEVARLGEDARLLDESNGLLRASVGGELRLRLPGVRQPARMIFSWNPLRLDRALQSSSPLTRLADPRGSIRFALGNVF